ncbi:hypothetical protein E1189_02960 [Sansalvadorimonas verongulae]|nr:hypothetical protein [Sansalvadorimonas verongulae]
MNQNNLSQSGPVALNDAGIASNIKSLEEQIEEHNLAFDAANSIFSKVESGLSNIAFNYWYPPHLYPQIYHAPQMQAFAPPIQTYQPFFMTSYLLGFAPYGDTRRLLIKKVTSKYDFLRFPNGTVFYDPISGAHTYKVEDQVEDPVPVADSSREVRIMVIQNLHSFFDALHQSIGVDTDRLRKAIDSSVKV